MQQAGLEIIKKHITTIFVSLFVYSQSISQTCEKYDRNLFHLIPDNFPDSINCKDKNGKKQGWWIYYKVLYNPVEKPDVLDKGNYIPDYIYGQYKNDLKVGVWSTIHNVHLIYEERQDNYYYSKDEVKIKSWFAYGGINNSEIHYLKDSTIIKSTSLRANEKYPICIECYKKNGNCTMTYRNEFIKIFPFENFESEFERTFFLFSLEKLEIDNKLK